MAISTNAGGVDTIELEPLNKPIPCGMATTPILKRKSGGGSKKLQFSTPEFSVTPIAPIPNISQNRMRPSRRREEAIVMANLRKRVAACDLERRRPPSDEHHNQQHHSGSGGAGSITGHGENELPETFDNRPLLPKISSKRDMSNDGEESPKSTTSLIQDKDFILDCLCWHNEYRARHAAPALNVSPDLCEHAQRWANHLAMMNEFYYRSSKTLGQNLFCCPCSALVTDLTGQEVASYWYSACRRYNYFKDINLLHTNVNAGHFTQMVWVKTKYFGIGKAMSKTGKMFVVAYYYPPGNIVNAFHENVLPPVMEQLPDHQQLSIAVDTDNNSIPPMRKSNSPNSDAGCSKTISSSNNSNNSNTSRSHHINNDNSN